MSTRFVFISVIHGCSIIRHGVARRLGSFSRLRFEVSKCMLVASGWSNLPALDKVLEHIAPLQLLILLILQLWNRLPHNVCE